MYTGPVGQGGHKWIGSGEAVAEEVVLHGRHLPTRRTCASVQRRCVQDRNGSLDSDLLTLRQDGEDDIRELR
jgi:hypothetical protein